MLISDWSSDVCSSGLSHAFHSAMMDAVVEPFHALVDATARSVPALPIVSTVSGDWLDAGSATSAGYWARHLRAPVRFAPALERLVDGGGARILLEVRSEEHTSELQSLMRISYAVFCLKKN